MDEYTDYDLMILLGMALRSKNNPAAQYIMCWRVIEQRILRKYAPIYGERYPDCLRERFNVLRQASYNEPLGYENLILFEARCYEAAEEIYKLVLQKMVKA